MNNYIEALRFLQASITKGHNTPDYLVDKDSFTDSYAVFLGVAAGVSGIFAHSHLTGQSSIDDSKFLLISLSSGAAAFIINRTRRGYEEIMREKKKLN